MWKNILGRGRPQMTLWRMRTACWISRAINALLRLCKIYCFSTVTMLARTRLKVTLYVHCLSCFSENRAACETMCKKYSTVREVTYDNIIRHMRFECWITMTMDTHSDYVMPVALPRQQLVTPTRLNITFIRILPLFLVSRMQATCPT